MLGPLITAGKIISSHISDLFPGADLDKPLSNVSQEAADLARKFLNILQECPKVQPVLRIIHNLDEELIKMVIGKDGGHYAYAKVVYFLMENKECSYS